MGIKNFQIHPLFFLFGLYYSLTGRIAIFIIYSLTATLHELGHSICASKRGYKLNNICLMPFGAIISGDMSGMSDKDELSIAFAGPLMNVAIALFFVALWWVVPPLYAITDIIVSANLSLAIINFFPFFPLDGGRILLCLLSKKLKREKALKVCKTIGVCGGAMLFTLFVATCFFTVNVSLLFFALFIIFGALSKKQDNKYLRLCSQISNKKLKRGVYYHKIGVDKDITIKRLLYILDSNCLNELVIYNDGVPFKVISPEKLEKLLQTADLNKPIMYYLSD